MLFAAVISLQIALAQPPVENVEYLPIPMTQTEWDGMTREQKLRYSDITIQGLRRNQQLALCPDLTSENLIKKIDEHQGKKDFLVSSIAIAVYSICI